MHLRKRAIAGISAVAVISVGAFAQAMFSDGGANPFSRGWDAIGSVLRPSVENQASNSFPNRRFGGSGLPDRDPVHPMVDANAARLAQPVLTAEQLEELRALSRDPMSFDLEDEALEGEKSAAPFEEFASLLTDGTSDRSERQPQRFGRSSNSGDMADRLMGGTNTDMSPSFQTVALAAIGGGGGASFVDPTQNFGGMSTADEPETVATPVPPAAVLFASVWAMIVGRRRLSFGRT